MATPIPSLGAARSDSRGELRLAERLKDFLEDTAVLWRNLPVGPRGRRPDFIVIHPDRGLRVLEVKDGRLDSLLSATKTEVGQLTVRANRPAGDLRLYAAAPPPDRTTAMLRYETIPVTPFAQNCSLVWCDRTREAAVIDPGGELERITAAAQRHGVRIAQILLTHAHIDHAGGTGTLARLLGVPIVGPHRADQFWIDALGQQARMFGFAPAEPFVPTRWLADGDTVQVGEVKLAVRHTPGHTPGHVVFHDPASKRAFVGDVLFAGSIGRTDFPGGDYDTLLASITQRLWPMGDDTVFIPGHGPESTFGRERRNNPYVGGT